MKRTTIKMLRSLASFIHWFIILPIICLALFVFVLPVMVVFLSICILFNPTFLDEETYY